MSSKLGCKSTALDVIKTFGEGKYLEGKTAIVTGGNNGIGLETCKALASAGCRVILCSRSVEKAEKAVAEEILKPGKGGYVIDDITKITIKQLDLDSFSSIKSFVTDYLSTEGDKPLDLLVLNAGIMATPSLQMTSSGFEKQIGNYVNYHLQYFVLTNSFH